MFALIEVSNVFKKVIGLTWWEKWTGDTPDSQTTPGIYYQTDQDLMFADTSSPIELSPIGMNSQMK